MTMHENMISLSTAAVQPAPNPRRYLSATHALNCYFECVEKIHGAPGLDPERLGMMVQCSPSNNNPHLDRIDDVRDLTDAFSYAEKRAPELYWRAWREHRVELKALSKIQGIPKSSAHRYVHVVDSYIESWLAERGLLVVVGEGLA